MPWWIYSEIGAEFKKGCKRKFNFKLEIRVSQKLVKLGERGGKGHKMSRMEGGGENWSKLCSLGGWV